MKLFEYQAKELLRREGIGVPRGAQVRTSQGAAGAAYRLGPVAVKAQATAITDPVYQYWVESPAGTWAQSGPYSTATTYAFTPTAAGTYRVVVYAKDPVALNTAAFAVTAAATVTVSG